MQQTLLAFTALTAGSLAQPVERDEPSECSPDHIAVPDVLGAQVLKLTAAEFHNHNVSVDQGVPDPYSVALTYCGVNM